MGKYIKEVPPTESEFVIQLTQSEVDMLTGIIADLLDNPQRRVRMKYEADDSYVAPTAQGINALKGAMNALGAVEQSLEYDYYDYWEDVDERVDSDD